MSIKILSVGLFYTVIERNVDNIYVPRDAVPKQSHREIPRLLWRIRNDKTVKLLSRLYINCLLLSSVF